MSGAAILENFSKVLRQGRAGFEIEIQLFKKSVAVPTPLKSATHTPSNAIQKKQKPSEDMEFSPESNQKGNQC